MSLVGSSCVAMTTFILPCVMYLKLWWKKIAVWEIVWICLVLWIGMVGAIIGMYQVIKFFFFFLRNFFLFFFSIFFLTRFFYAFLFSRDFFYFYFYFFSEILFLFIFIIHFYFLITTQTKKKCLKCKVDLRIDCRFYYYGIRTRRIRILYCFGSRKLL